MAVGHSIAHHHPAPLVLALIMATNIPPSVNPDLYPSGVAAGSTASAVSWSAIVAGTVAAIALTLTLVTIGAAFGFASVSPWPGVGAAPSTFTIATGVWLIVTQWLSAAAGGYLAGRMRVRWHGLHTDEVFFRDTAHGLLTWATYRISDARSALPRTIAMSLGLPMLYALERGNLLVPCFTCFALGYGDLIRRPRWLGFAEGGGRRGRRRFFPYDRE